jgi:putative addiction module component (TIGR02574 family)
MMEAVTVRQEKLMPTMKDLGIDTLSVDDRLALAAELLDSVEAEAESAPLTTAQADELGRRLSDSIANPDAVTPWEQVYQRALARAKR